MAAGGHFGCQNSLSMAFLAISDKFIQNFFNNFFTKWPPTPIVDVQNSLLITFLAISDRYATLIGHLKWPPAAILSKIKKIK